MINKKSEVTEIGRDFYSFIPHADISEHDCVNAAANMYEKGYRRLSDHIIEIPALVGDTIWYIDKSYKVQEAQVVRICIDGYYSRYLIATRYDYDTEDTIRLALRFDDLNNSYWLTKEPAEERLVKIINSLKISNNRGNNG